MPDIFDEVADDLRAERARRLLTRYGGVIVAALLLVIAGAGGFELWKHRRASASDAVAVTYIAAMQTAAGPEPARPAAMPEFARVASQGDSGYRALARLQEAALRANAGDLPAALALWDAVAQDTNADSLLRDCATLEWASHQIDSGDPAIVAQRLQKLAAPENPWHSLAEEQQALLDLRQGHNDAARDTLKRIAADVTAPDGARGRANGLLSRLGGS